MTQQSNMSVILYLVCWSHSAGAPPLPPLQQCPEVSHLHCSQLPHWHPGWWDTCNNSTQKKLGLREKDIYRNMLLNFSEQYYSDSLVDFFLGQTLAFNGVKRKGGIGNCHFLMRKQLKDRSCVMLLLVQCQNWLTPHNSLHLLLYQSHLPNTSRPNYIYSPINIKSWIIICCKILNF